MTIPVLVPPSAPELAVPYLTAAQFQAYPTWLDLDNLVPGGAAGIQTDALNDVLLAASGWAIEECSNMPLHAHYVQNERFRTRPGNTGRIYIKPRDIPVRAITALSWGCDPSAMTAVTLPDASMWVEDGREVSFVPGGGVAQFTGPAIQFGGPALPGSQVYVSWSYVPGFPSTLMPSGVAQGASSVTVADPTGILPGDVLRIYDVGQSEALTVAASYVPAVPASPPTATAIPLAANTAHAHAAGVGITGMPRQLLQAIYAYGVALLMRDDVSAEEPASAFGPAARTVSGNSTAGKAGGLVNDAERWLQPFKPTLRS